MSQIGILAFQTYLAYIVHGRSSSLDGEVGGGDHTLVSTVLPSRAHVPPSLTLVHRLHPWLET